MKGIRFFPLFVAAAFYHSIAWAALVVNYVNPLSTDGGDGTTTSIDPSDAHRAYKYLKHWEAQNINLVGAGNSMMVICDSTATDVYPDGGVRVDTTSVNVSGWTTSATSSITITVGPNSVHKGTYTASGYRLETANTGMTITDGFVTVDGLLITSTRTSSSFPIIISGGNVEAGSTYTIKNCILRGIADGNETEFRGIYDSGNVAHTSIFINDLIYFPLNTNLALNQSGSNGFPACVKTEATTVTSYLYNITCASGAFTGFEQASGFMIVKNSVVQNAASTNYSGCASTSADNTAGDTSTCGQAGRTSKTVTFVNPAAQDWRIAANSVGVSSCPSLSTDTLAGFTYDFDGGTRATSGAGTWDCGCDEHGTDWSTVAGGGGGGGGGNPTSTGSVVPNLPIHSPMIITMDDHSNVQLPSRLPPVFDSPKYRYEDWFR